MPYFEKIYADERLPNRAKLVYIYLHDRMDGERKAWPAISTIAAELSLSRSTVKRAVADLERAGYIEKKYAKRKNGGQTANRYFLL